MRYKGYTIYTKQYDSGAWEAGMRSKRDCGGARTFSGPMFDSRSEAVAATRVAIDSNITMCKANPNMRKYYKHA